MSTFKRNNVRISGAPTQPMMFVHGYGCDQTVWRFVAPAFEPDHQVLLFDHVGMGGSDAASYDADKYSSLAGYAEDTLDICRELALRDAVLVGHSIGSIIGALAAIADPARFAALILITPSPCFMDDGDYVGGLTRASLDELIRSLAANYPAWARTMAPVIMGNPDRPDLAVELAALFCRMDPRVAEAFARVTFLVDVRAELPRVRTRSLIMQCSEDALAPPAVGYYMRDHMPGSRLVVMRATGHCPHLSAPAETIAAIRAFLAERAG